MAAQTQQDQRKTDSLVKIYQDNKLVGKDKLELLKKLVFNEINDLDKALGYADELIELSESINDLDYLYSGHLHKGYKYMKLGKLELALAEFIECSNIATITNDLSGQGVVNMSIGDVYNRLDNFIAAEEYYIKAIEILRQTDGSYYFAGSLINISDVYIKNKKYDEALEIINESGNIYKKLNNQQGIAYYLGNTGMALLGKNKDSIAEYHLKQAIDTLKDLKDYYPICVYLLSLSDIYVKKGDMTTAFSYANNSLELAKQFKLKEQIGDAYLKLSELYELTNNLDSVSVFYQRYLDYKKSIINVESVQKIADLRTYYEVSQKQMQVDLLIQRRKTQRIVVYATTSTLLLILWLSVVLYRKNKFVRATNKIISSEKQRSDNLLMNILPEETAQELKVKGKVQAKRFESVTILFTDFEGFTRYAEHLPPEDVVTAIDFYFSKFDKIIEKFGLEKIKTVGDAYMCAGGLPLPTEDHAYKVVLAAIEIMKFVNEVKVNSNEPLAQFDIRIGINTGPVVAGVVGSKKFAYDIWGDSVNIASRMESCSKPGKINISENTYTLVKDKINCKFRGNIEVKNRGELAMYFVDCLNDKEKINL